MIKYQYMLIDPDYFESNPGVGLRTALMAELDRLGSDGWEVVSFEGDEYLTAFRILLKRRTDS